MFTGIIEELGKVVSVQRNGSNKIFEIQSSFSKRLKINQSIAINGACLSVKQAKENSFIVEAIAETLSRTNLSFIEKGDSVNLERAMKLSDRLDGHLVLGHIDATGEIISIKKLNGPPACPTFRSFGRAERASSWIFSVMFPSEYKNLIIPKGSISMNGISLTVIDVKKNVFDVAIIPYTYTHTNLQFCKAGDKVNLEFDMAGKYVLRVLKN